MKKIVNIFLMVLVIIPISAFVAFTASVSGYLYYLGHYAKEVGTYIPSSDVIILRTYNRTPQSIEITNIHEMGHKIYWDYLDDELKEEFENISIKFRNTPDIFCIEGYKNTTTEDFADSYRQFNLHNYFAFRDCQEKLDYFKQLELEIMETKGINIR